MAARPPQPRGRAALLATLRAMPITPGEDAKPEEPPKPKGRAALLNKIREMSLKVSVGATHDSEEAPQTNVNMRDVQTPELSTCSFKGTMGESIHISANYIRLSFEKDKGIFEYELQFTPDLDMKQFRIKLLNSIVPELGGVKMFDGGTVVYLPSRLTKDRTEFIGKHPVDDSPIKMVLTYKKAKRLYECMHFFNVLLKRIMIALQLTRFKRDYFDMKASCMIPQHKLEVLPGYAVAADEYEGGLMLCLDTQHRVLRTDTALELMCEIRLCAREQFKERVINALIGSVVLTKYNNKTYFVHDIAWNITPRDTFETESGEKISFVEYYKLHYGITIIDFNQPMLLHMQKVHKNAQPGIEERAVLLVPELCHLTGLTADSRADFRVMKDVAQYTRITPQQRMDALNRYVRNVHNNEQAQKVLSDWGLKLADGTIDLNARILNPETIVFGREVTHVNDRKADWTGALAKNSVFSPVDLKSWAVVYTEKDSRIAKELVDNMMRLGNTLGMMICRPSMHPLSNDKTGSYVSKCQQLATTLYQMIIFVFPSLRNDLYTSVKKFCCLQQPIPIQCIISRTLQNQKKVRTVTLKVTLQILCKIGGSPWSLKIPVKSWMVIGIDVYHSSATSSKQSTLGFVASTNDTFTKYYSMAHLQSQEVSAFLKICFVKALERSKDDNGCFPEKVIVFRDGVGEGQFDHVKNFELSQFEEVIAQFNLKTTVTYVIVQKRVNTRIFLADNQTRSFVNPLPGTILDHTITKKFLFDYYLVPQSVNQGTVTPTRYIVLSNKCGIKPDHLQKLSFKLCHLYYNWSGTVRVPAPCQYAHKIAHLIGQYVGKEALEPLNDKLYYL